MGRTGASHFKPPLQHKPITKTLKLMQTEENTVRLKWKFVGWVCFERMYTSIVQSHYSCKLI